MLRRTATRAGFTLLEILIALTVVGLVLGNIVMVMRSSSDAHDGETSRATLELQLDQTLDGIVLALMAASSESLEPGASAPAFHDRMEYMQSLGVNNGKLVLGAPERIEMRIDQGEIIWIENPGEVSERRRRGAAGCGSSSRASCPTARTTTATDWSTRVASPSCSTARRCR